MLSCINFFSSHFGPLNQNPGYCYRNTHSSQGIRSIYDIAKSSFIFFQTQFGSIDRSNMETKPVPEVLSGEDNYLKLNFLEWSVRVKTNLMAEDLWDIVESTNEPPTPENEAAFKTWRRMNAKALRVIHSSLGPGRLSDIMEITSARIAWEMLAEKYKPKGPDPSSR